MWRERENCQTCISVVNQKQEAVCLHISSAAVLTAYFTRLGSALVFGFIMSDSSDDSTLLNA